MYVGVNFASSLILLSDFGTVSLAVWYFPPSFYWLLNPRPTNILYMSHENIYCNTKLIYSTVLDTTQLLHRYKSNIGNNWQKLICQYS